MCLMPACPRVPQAEATSQRAQHVISAVRQQLAEAESQLASDLACPPAEHQQRAPGLLDLPPEVCCSILEQLERRDRQAGQPGMRACSRAGPAAGDNSVAACCPSSAVGSAWRPPAVPFGGPLCAGSATTSLCCGPTSAGRRSTSPGCAECKVSWHGARGRAADALGRPAAPAPASGPPALTTLPLAPLAPCCAARVDLAVRDNVLTMSSLALGGARLVALDMSVHGVGELDWPGPDTPRREFERLPAELPGLTELSKLSLLANRFESGWELPAAAAARPARMRPGAGPS